MNCFLANDAIGQAATFAKRLPSVGQGEAYVAVMGDGQALRLRRVFLCHRCPEISRGHDRYRLSIFAQDAVN